MCVLHDSDEYGVARYPLKELAQAAGVICGLAKELAAKSVLKGSDTELTEPYVYIPRSGRKDGEPVTLVPAQKGPIWFSSRMVRDEYVRTVRGDSGRNGEANDDAPKPAPKPPKGVDIGPRTPAQSSSSSSSATPKEQADDDAHERARALLTRVCERLGVELQADPSRLTWINVVTEMLRDGIPEQDIMRAADITRTKGHKNINYVRTVAISLATESQNGNGNRARGTGKPNGPNWGAIGEFAREDSEDPGDDAAGGTEPSAAGAPPRAIAAPSDRAADHQGGTGQALGAAGSGLRLESNGRHGDEGEIPAFLLRARASA